MDKPAENNHNNALRPARIFTLGCRLNQADTALLTDRLRQLGYYVQNPGEKSAPELVIVNSCAVTAAAAAKSRQAARKFQQLYPECRIVFTGCAAEINDQNIKDENWLMLGNVQKRDLAEVLQKNLAPAVIRDVQ